MDERLRASKVQLLEVEDVLHRLYPDLRSVGSPFYIIKRSRVATKLVFSDGKKRCTAVAKLLLEASIGRRLTGRETCDHIDSNSLNDAMSNLQILSLSDNARKGPSAEVKARVSSESRIRMTGEPRPDLCGSKNGLAKLTDQQADEIRSRSFPYIRGNDKKLAIEYGVSRELVSQIRRGIIRKSI